MPDIFLDRDGVINYNRTDHVKCWEEFEFLPGSIEALVSLKKAGYRVFVITNQAIVNRGDLSSATLDSIHYRMQRKVARAGGWIEAVLYCPHLPEEKCPCRKPQAGLIHQAEQYYGAQAAGNWLVGDHINDLDAGERAGCRTLLVLSGRGAKSFAEANLGQTRPDTLVADDLAAAVKIILEQPHFSLNRSLAKSCPPVHENLLPW